MKMLPRYSKKKNEKRENYLQAYMASSRHHNKSMQSSWVSSLNKCLPNQISTIIYLCKKMQTIHGNIGIRQ